MRRLSGTTLTRMPTAGRTKAATRAPETARGPLAAAFPALLLAALLTVGGCGQMGPLYRPQPPAQESSPGEP